MALKRQAPLVGMVAGVLMHLRKGDLRSRQGVALVLALENKRAQLINYLIIYATKLSPLVMSTNWGPPSPLKKTTKVDELEVSDFTDVVNKLVRHMPNAKGTSNSRNPHCHPLVKRFSTLLVQGKTRHLWYGHHRWLRQPRR